MALVHAGQGHKRSLDHDLPLVPFIDFLLCLIAFLLVTAVWTQMSRLPADARVPGGPEPGPATAEAALHVRLSDRDFELSWRKGELVLDQKRVARTPVVLEDGTRRYPGLGEAVAASFREHGRHRAASDPARDRAVLHASNSVEFADIVAVLDALGSTTRPAALDGGSRVPAFAVTFAPD